MSVQMNVVEFEQREAYLSSELDSGPPYSVHGIALGADDITRGASGVKKLWPAAELEKAAKTLEGTNLVENHENDARGVVGEVTKAGYKEGVGVIYEAELFDDELADSISNGLLEVSVRGFHMDVDEMELDEESGAKVVEDIEFDNLSIVSSGASPSNTLEIGEHDELSSAELSAYVATLQEIEPGMWVQSGDTKGITISQVEDGEIEVDVYEERDGQWRSTEETKMMSTDSLDEWDVDEDDIGPVEDEDSEEEEEDSEEEEENAELAAEGDKVEWDDGAAQGVVRDTKADGCFNEEIDGDVEVCASDDEAAVLIEIVKDGEPTGTMVAHKEGTLSDADFEMSKHKMDPSVEDDEESEQVDPPEFEEGMMVQWSVNPDMFGKVVHNPDDEEIVMVEVMEMMDGEMKPTGHTLTAAPPDLEEKETDEELMAEVPEDHRFESEEEAADAAEEMGIEGAHEMEFDGETMWVPGNSHDEYMKVVEEAAETYADYPDAASENAQMALDAREETDNPNDCGTDVGWRRANQLASGEAVSRDVVAKMSAFNRHRSNKDQGDEGRENCGWMMWKAWGGDEGVDWAMNKMDEIEEASRLPNPAKDEAELQATHDPEWDSAADKEWNSPDLEDFTDESWEDLDGDEKTEIANHFLVSKTGEFPPERFSDLALPVVEPDGTLNLNALANAKARAGQVEEVSSEDEEDINEMINSLANDNFDANFEEAGHKAEGEEFTGDQGKDNQPWRFPENDGDTDPNDPEDSGVHEDLSEEVVADAEENGVSVRNIATDGSVEDDKEAETMDPVECALDLINIFLRQNGKDERDSVDKMLGWIFSSTDIPTHKIELFRTAANAFLDAQGGTDSFGAVDVESFRDWLLTQGGQTDDGTHAQKRDGAPTIATPVHVLSGDDLRSVYYTGASKKDDSTTEDNITMTNIEEELEELDEPVAVEKDDFESLQEKADRMDEMSETLASLQERTDVLDSVDREQVEELAEGEDPVVLESSEYEELRAEAEQVKEVYADALSGEDSPFTAEELSDKFSIEELREKYEEAGHDLEEELNAEPRSGDVDEEELESRAEEEQQSEEELEKEEEIESKQAELRDKILGGD